MPTPDSNIKRLKSILEKRSQEVLKRFRQVTVSKFCNPELIKMLEKVNTNWKDLHRPALTSFACQAVGGELTKTDDASLIISLAAAGMGVHDDIIDKSENKHFRKTILGNYGLDRALLVGDLLLIKSLTTALKHFEKNCPDEKRDAVFDAFQNFVFEIYEGELMDISCRKNLNTDLEDYLKILWKLAADGEACSRIGAILGGGSEDEIQALAEFGRRLGLIIIFKEEVRDVLNHELNLPHKIEFESVPLPILYAAKSSENAYSQVISILQKSSIAPFVSEIRKLCWESGAIKYMYDLARKNARQATAKLASIKQSQARDVLSLMIDVPLGELKKVCNDENPYL